MLHLKIGDLGERRLSEMLGRVIGMEFEDAGYVDNVVVNIDTTSLSAHWAPLINPYDYGWRAGIRALSDVIVKCGVPKYALIALLVEKGREYNTVKKVIEGVNDSLSKYGVKIVNGDIVSSKEFALTVTVLGHATNIVRRKGAQPGDVVVSIGDFGWTTLAFLNLFFEITFDKQVLERALKYLARPSLTHASKYLELCQKIQITSSIDSSDGLSRSLEELSRRSNVMLEIEKIPINKIVLKEVEKYGFDETIILNIGGEEYSFIFTIPHDKTRLLKKIIPSAKIIGRVRDGKGVFYRGTEIKGGWNHFKGWELEKTYRANAT